MTDRVTDLSRAGRIGLAALALVAIIAAMFSGGGPGAGRADTRDAARWHDLSRLSDLALCIAREDGVLPEVLGPHDICDTAPPLTDPFTGEDYAFRVLSDDSFRLCAGFERPEQMLRRFGSTRHFNAQTGCLTVQRRDG